MLRSRSRAHCALASNLFAPHPEARRPPAKWSARPERRRVQRRAAYRPDRRGVTRRTRPKARR